MKILKKKKREKMVRIIIGNTKTGSSLIKAPTKTITLIETTVNEVYKKIMEIFSKEK